MRHDTIGLMASTKTILTETQASFDQLVDFLEAHGNPVLGKRWRTDKEGLHTYMTKPIDMALVKNHFTPDNTVILSDTSELISIRQQWMEIVHRPGLQYNPQREGYGDAYFYPEGYFDFSKLKTIYINQHTGEVFLGKANIRPGSRLSEFPQLKGKMVGDMLSIPLPWNFKSVPWFAGIIESKKLFRSHISKIILSACPDSSNTNNEDSSFEEKTAFIQQEFLEEQLGTPHDKGSIVTHYKKSPIPLYASYQFPWGKVDCCWDPKNMRAGSIEISYD